MAFAPTHRAPDGGLDAYVAPDPAPGAASQIPTGLEVEVIERRADWAQVRTGNGWEGWVDGRRLVEIPTASPVTSPPPPPVATPTPTPVPPTPPVATESAGWAAPAVTTPTTSGLGIGSILAIVGAAVALVSTWFNWIDFDPGFGSSFTRSAWGTPAYFLLDKDSGGGGLQLGYVILALCVLILVGALVRQLGWLSIVAGAVTVLIPLRFYMQVNDGFSEDTGLGVFDFATIFPVIALIGGVLGIVGGVLMLTQKR